MLNKVYKVYEPVFPCKKIHSHRLGKQWKLKTENIITCYMVLNNTQMGAMDEQRNRR